MDTNLCLEWLHFQNHLKQWCMLEVVTSEPHIAATQRLIQLQQWSLLEVVTSEPHIAATQRPIQLQQIIVQELQNILQYISKTKRKMNGGLRILLGILAVGLIIASVVILVILLLRVGGQAPRVTVSCGLLEGTFDISKNVYSFKVNHLYIYSVKICDRILTIF